MIPDLEIEIKPNVFLNIILFSLIFLALGMIWVLDLFVIIKSILSVSLLIYAFYALNHHVFFSFQNSVRHLAWSKSQGWRVNSVPAELKNNSIFTGYYLILNFQVSNLRCVYTSIIFLSRNNHKNFRHLVRIHKMQ